MEQTQPILTRKKLIWIILLSVFAMLGLFAFVFLRGENQTHAVWDEDAYIANILAIEPFDPPVYADVTNVDELLSHNTCNLLVRCTAVSRAAADVHDPLKIHTTESLIGGVKEGLAYIATPYLMEIKEIYHGDEKLFSVGQQFYYYAQYGELYGYTDVYRIRYEHYPIFRVGNDYILFFEVWDLAGALSYELIHPGAVLEITQEDPQSFRTPSDLGEVIFAKYDFTLSKFETDLERLKEDHLHRVSLPYLENLPTH